MYINNECIIAYENLLEVFIIPRVERNLDINSSVNKVFKILDDPQIGVKWNLAVNEIKELELGKFSVKSNVGDFISIRTETIENERLSMDIEGGIFSAMGYILLTKGNLTNVTIWGEFENKKREKILVKAGELILKSLKNYVEYLEEGGDPDSYDKKQITVTP